MKTLSFRPLSSDWLSIMQVFGQEQFSIVAGILNVKVIVDLGAYSGYASYYLKYLYPDAKLIAVEPQGEPFSMCVKTLKGLPYVHLLQGAIWHERVTQLYMKHMHKNTKKFFHETATQIFSKRVGKATGCVTMAQIFGDYNISKIDLLKVDIEGTENLLFGPSCAPWIDKVRNIVIEFHSPEALEIMRTALSKYSYIIHKHGELHFFKNIRKKV